MAEFALGLTKTAVEGTVSRVKSAIEEEANLKVRVQNDLVFITGEFQMMQSFLSVANKERTNNEVVRTWVRQIRDLAFDVEDCVEFIVSLDTKSGWSWLWRVPPGCMAAPRPLDQAVTEIKQLKARVEDVSHRNIRYNLIGDSSSKSNSSKPKLPDAGASLSAFHILREVWEAAGKMRHDMRDLKRLITNEGSDLEMITLWDSSGSAADLGTTSIVGKMYNDPQICQEFKTRAWVKLVHPFNLEEFLKSLLTQFFASSHRANIEGVHFRKMMKASEAIEDELIQQVYEQKYLVIVEQVSTMVEWDAMKMYLPNSKNGSRIVMAVQQLGLALSSSGQPYQVSELKKISDGRSLCAFFKKAGQFNGIGESEGPCRVRHFKQRRDSARDWTSKFELVGRENELCDLQNQLQDPCVIFLWGFSGVGKSALVRTVYYQQMLKQSPDSYLDECAMYSWVDVPRPCNLMEFSRRLFLDFHSVDLKTKENAALCIMEDQDTIEECREFLREAKYLIVIDGLQSVDDWELIKATFLSKPTKGCIIVITSEASVVTQCVYREDRVLNVKGLNAMSALQMFKKICWGNEQLTREEAMLSELVVRSCGGLPKVIAAIGEYCHAQTSIVTSLLEYIKSDFLSKLETMPEFRSLRDQIIRRRRLVRRWIAEAYVGDTEANTAEENGERLFSELLDLSVIQQPPRSKVSCQVNGFFRDYVFSLQKDDKLVFALEGRCSLYSQHTGRHLSIRSCWDRDMNVFKGMDLSRLRSLTVFGQWSSFFISNDTNISLLRVLDLEDAVGVRDEDLEEIVKAFPRLKFLSLRGCKDITCLPDSLGVLMQLQTLDVRQTQVAMLPRSIIKLVKLQYVRAGYNLPEDWRSTMADNRASESTKDGDDTVGDGTSRSQAGEESAEGDGISTILPTTAAAVVSAEGDCRSTNFTSPAAANGTSEPATGGEDDCVSTSQRQPPAAAAEIVGTSTSPTSATNIDDTSTNQLAVATTTEGDPQAATTLVLTSNKARGFVSCSWLSKKLCGSRPRDDICGGVKVRAAMIVNLTALHTLGVVNVSGAGGKAFLMELKKLTQLRKLGVSGINHKNWDGLYSVISDHAHLESLSVHIDKEEPDAANFIGHMFFNLPQTLKSLKLYTSDGKGQVSPYLVRPLYNLTKVHLQLTISRQEEIDILYGLPCQGAFRNLCIKAIQDGKLRYGHWDNNWSGRGFKAATFLRIDCGSYRLAIVFGKRIPEYVEVLVVQCSAAGSSLELSGLEELNNLKEVWLMGSYNKAVKQHLQEKLSEHHLKPVLKIKGRPTQE